MYLTFGSADLTAGNFLGDMIRNRELPELPGEVRAGVYIHRFIDSFTDRHPEVRKVVGLLRDHQGKYAPVAADMLFDHVLAIHWDRFSVLDYKAFCDTIYDALHQKIAVVPARLRPRAESMILHRWIDDYDKEERFRRTLQRLDVRTRFPSNLEVLPSQYMRFSDEVDGAFFSFFPEIIREVKHQVTLQNAARM